MTYKFVDLIPRDIEEDTIYISVKFSTAIHKCACGCQREVVTPISPTNWKLTFHGKSISLYPSIGNWGFECQSHYWIKENEIVWAERWSERKILANKEEDLSNKLSYYNKPEKLQKSTTTKLKNHNLFFKLLKKVRSLFCQWK